MYNPNYFASYFKWMNKNENGIQNKIKIKKRKFHKTEAMIRFVFVHKTQF